MNKKVVQFLDLKVFFYKILVVVEIGAVEKWKRRGFLERRS